MRGEILLKILQTIGEIALYQADFLIALSHTSRSGSSKQLRYQIEKARRSREKFFQELITKEREKKYLQTTISKLKNNGLIIVDDNGKLVLTDKGESKKEKLLAQLALHLPSTKYKFQKSDQDLIIIFDLPKKEGDRKRFWLRDALRNLNFKMIQKSVYIGKIKLPKEFIEDCQELNLLHYLHFFTVIQKGTL